MALTNLKVQKAKPRARQYKLADERGMYLLIHPKGGKYWRLDYRFEGRRKTLAIGTHPETSLKEARKKLNKKLQRLNSVSSSVENVRIRHIPAVLGRKTSLHSQSPVS